MATDIVHQGTLHKLGGNVKSWTKRWMVLKKDNVLYYYKDPNKSPQGSIPLTDHMFLAKEGRERDLNWPKTVGIERTIVIRTSYRIYYMYADTQPEAAEWIERLQKTAESIPGKKVAKRFVPKSAEVPAGDGKSHPKSASVSSNLSASIDTVESLYDAAKQPDSDCSISTDEENGQGPDSVYSVPPSSELAENDAIYEATDDDPSHSRTSSSNSSTTPAPLVPSHGVSSGGGNQPIYEDADLVPATKPPDDHEVYEVVNDQQPAWAASRHLPPSDPPPPPPDDDDDDEDTVPLPQPAIPPKNSSLPPPIPTRGSAAKLTNGGDDSPPAVPLRKTAASSPKIIDNGNYSLLEKIEKPPMSTSPPALIQKSRIDSPVTGTISPTEIESLKYEPEEDSEEFYVDMAVNDETANKDQLKLEAQRQKELEERKQRLEEERQRELEEQRQREHEVQRQRQQEAEAELQRQREMKLKQQELENATDKTKRLSQVELEAQQQAEYEARVRKEMEDKKKERLDYLANKSRSTPDQLAVNDTNDAKKKRSGTNMFKAQRNRLVESVDTEKETNSGKPNTAAWLAIEREKTLMQEEKLKLEQEKRRLEEERQNFEREKRRMQMEMARLKQ